MGWRVGQSSDFCFLVCPSPKPVHTHTLTQMHTHTHTHTHACTHTHTHACIHRHTHTCAHAGKHMKMYIYNACDILHKFYSTQILLLSAYCKRNDSDLWVTVANRMLKHNEVGKAMQCYNQGWLVYCCRFSCFLLCDLVEGYWYTKNASA